MEEGAFNKDWKRSVSKYNSFLVTAFIHEVSIGIGIGNVVVNLHKVVLTNSSNWGIFCIFTSDNNHNRRFQNKNLIGAGPYCLLGGGIE